MNRLRYHIGGKHEEILLPPEVILETPEVLVMFFGFKQEQFKQERLKKEGLCWSEQFDASGKSEWRFHAHRTRQHLRSRDKGAPVLATLWWR
jgi:hypothetical protein